jgi:hypothetical protein
MGCIIRECDECGYADGDLPPRRFGRYTCPRCGASMTVEFDEERDHGPEPEPEYEEEEAFE